MSTEAILISALVGMTAVLGSVIVALIAARTNRQANAVQWAAQLKARLDTVEEKVEEQGSELISLRRVLSSAARFIDRLFIWGKGGGRIAPPTPPTELHDLIDIDQWRQLDRDNFPPKD